MSERDRGRNVVVPAAIAAVAAVIAVVLFVVPTPGASEGSEESAPTTDRPADAGQRGGSGLARRNLEDALARGDVDAPVVMVEYSDFQCPFCGKFARDVEPRLVDQYVEDGTLRIEWRDFPYLGAESMTAAKAGRAAARQGRFWAFHHAMYADQLPPNSGNLDRDHVGRIAEEIGLDRKQFLADMDDPAVQESIEQDFREGQDIGVTGTPTFVINGRAIVGAQPVEAFEQVIEQAANEARK